MNPPSTSARELLHAKLDALLHDCEKVMNNADYGQVVNNFNDFLLIAGKQFIQDVFQKKLQDPIEQQEQRSKLKQYPHCKKNESPK